MVSSSVFPQECHMLGKSGAIFISVSVYLET